MFRIITGLMLLVCSTFTYTQVSDAEWEWQLTQDRKPELWIESGNQNNYVCQGIHGDFLIRISYWKFDTDINVTLNATRGSSGLSVSTPDFDGHVVTIPVGSRGIRVPYVTGPDFGRATLTVQPDPSNRFNVGSNTASIRVQANNC